MQFKRGRMIDHIHLRTRDLPAAKRFYKAILDELNIDYADEADHFSADELWIDAGEQSSRIHFSFQAPDRETVDRIHQAALQAGGKDNGKPGERPYHPGYYAAFFLDPDGNNIEATHHGPVKRSADAVVFTTD